MDITQELIDEMKAKHGEVFQINVGDKSALLKKPDRKTLGYANSIGTKDPIKFNEVILNNCWLVGDEEIKTDDTLFLSAGHVLNQLIELREATLVKC